MTVIQTEKKYEVYNLDSANALESAGLIIKNPTYLFVFDGNLSSVYGSYGQFDPFEVLGYLAYREKELTLQEVHSFLFHQGNNPRLDIILNETGEYIAIHVDSPSEEVYAQLAELIHKANQFNTKEYRLSKLRNHLIGKTSARHSKKIKSVEGVPYNLSQYIIRFEDNMYVVMHSYSEALDFKLQE